MAIDVEKLQFGLISITWDSTTWKLLKCSPCELSIEKSYLLHHFLFAFEQRMMDITEV